MHSLFRNWYKYCICSNISSLAKFKIATKRSIVCTNELVFTIISMIGVLDNVVVHEKFAYMPSITGV